MFSVTFLVHTPPLSTNAKSERQYMQLLVLSDCYLDIDQQYTLCFEVSAIRCSSLKKIVEARGKLIIQILPALPAIDVNDVDGE